MVAGLFLLMSAMGHALPLIVAVPLGLFFMAFGCLRCFLDTKMARDVAEQDRVLLDYQHHHKDDHHHHHQEVSGRHQRSGSGSTTVHHQVHFTSASAPTSPTSSSTLVTTTVIAPTTVAVPASGAPDLAYGFHATSPKPQPIGPVMPTLGGGGLSTATPHGYRDDP
eukprot:EC789157.1.p2 GENE.EC789157.1~~EC789157.1.p2  ORF type:complete len:180 (+),score=40.40 EC789157.1:43-540(+)